MRKSTGKPTERNSQSAVFLVPAPICTFFFHGLALTHPINGAILMLVTPLFVGIFDHIRVKAYPKTWFVIGTLLAAAGSLWLMIGKGAVFNRQTLTGDLFVAVNALFYAIYLVRVKRIAHLYKPITINKITFTFGTLYMLPIGGLALMHTDFYSFTPHVTAKVVYILFFTSFLVYLLNSYAVKKSRTYTSRAVYLPSTRLGQCDCGDSRGRHTHNYQSGYDDPHHGRRIFGHTFLTQIIQKIVIFAF